MTETTEDIVLVPPFTVGDSDDFTETDYNQYFLEEAKPLDGKKKKIDEILNIEILITWYRICKRQYNIFFLIGLFYRHFNY
jgi:hypothetical protein